MKTKLYLVNRSSQTRYYFHTANITSLILNCCIFLSFPEQTNSRKPTKSRARTVTQRYYLKLFGWQHYQRFSLLPTRTWRFNCCFIESDFTTSIFEQIRLVTDSRFAPKEGEDSLASSPSGLEGAIFTEKNKPYNT